MARTKPRSRSTPIPEPQPQSALNKWFTSQISMQTVAMIIAGLIAAVAFWDDSKDNWKKTGDVEIGLTKKADAEEVKALKEQVNRQYQVQRERDAQQDANGKENSDWIEQQKGYHQALLEHGIIGNKNK